MARMQSRSAGWLGRFRLGWQADDAMGPQSRADLDLPPAPFDPDTQLALPRSPEPLPDEALRFARSARARDGQAAQPAAGEKSMAAGTDWLLPLADEDEQHFSLHQAVEYAREAQRRVAERLDPREPEWPIPWLASTRPAASVGTMRDAEAALTDALALLRTLSEGGRG
jgi:hypothetical protein